MAEFLVMRFHDCATEAVEWITVDQTGALIGELATGDPLSAAAAAIGHKVIALVPGIHVLRTQIKMPVRGTAKIMQALPYAMEEQLAADVDELHFAVGKRDSAGDLQVAVVERLAMEAWLELLAAAGLEPIGFYADSDAIGVVPNTTTLFVEADTVTLRDASGSILVADLDSAETTLELWLAARAKAAADDSSASAINLLAYVEPAAQTRVDALLAGLSTQVESVDVRLLGDGALPRLASQIVVEPGVNLLQGMYSPRSNYGAYWLAWRAAAILLASLGLVVVGAQILEISQLNRQAAALDTAIEQGIRYTFPEVREVRDARGLLQSKLRGLGAATGGNSDFLDTLGAVAAAVTAPDGDVANVETINYRSGVMELRVTAPNVQSLDEIQKEIIKGNSLQAEIQSANPEGDKVRGRIQIKAKGA
jgi:general secretion pathway protein L